MRTFLFNKKAQFIFIILIGAILGIILAIFRGSYGKELQNITFTKEELQEMVVATALSYFYNHNYSDYEQKNMDIAGTFAWRSFRHAPEDVSRSNFFNSDCSAFASMVYLYSLGFDFSDYAALAGYKDDDFETANSKYQNKYLQYGLGSSTGFMTNVAEYVFKQNNNINTLDSGIEYVNNDLNSEVVYYYRVDLKNDVESNNNLNEEEINDSNLELDNSNNCNILLYNESCEEQQNIKNNIINTLQPGDLLVYRRYDKKTSSYKGHVVVYVGDALKKGERGFIHSTGNDYNPTNIPITINEDYYSIRYDTWDNYFINNLFKDDNDAPSYAFTIIRPINSYCDSDYCTISREKIKSNMYKENYDKYLNNTIARSELSRLKIEQYEYKDDDYRNIINKYNSINVGDNISYIISFSNKSNMEYCENGSYSYSTKANCINKYGELFWKATDGKIEDYKNLTISAQIPDGTEFVSCSSNCIYDENNNILKWSNISIMSNDTSTKSYSYKVKVKSGTQVANKGMIITTASGNKLQMGELLTQVNTTINNSNDISIIQNNINELGNSINKYASSIDFIKDVYYKSYGFNIDSFDYDKIKNAIFNTSGSYYTKKTDYAVSNLTDVSAININRMLVSGLYGGRKLKGNDNGDRPTILVKQNIDSAYRKRTLEIGDVIITYDFNNNANYAWLFYGYDSNSRYIFVTYDNDITITRTTDNEGNYVYNKDSSENKLLKIYDSNLLYDKVKYTSSSGTEYNEGKSGWRIFKEIYAYDLFVVLRPTKLYGTTLTYELNDGVMENNSLNFIVYDTYKNLPTPTKNGYKFLGWYTDKEFKTEVTDGSKLVTNDSHTLYAKWENTNFVLGDVNGDGLVNIEDAKDLAKYIVDDDNNGINISAGDLNKDGMIKMNDVISLLNNILDNY